MWGLRLRLKDSGLVLGFAVRFRFRSLALRLGRFRVGFARLGFGFGLLVGLSLRLDLRFSLGPLHRIARLWQIGRIDLRLFDRTASRLDRSPRTLRGANTLERHGLLELARQDDLGALRKHRDNPG